MKTMLKIRNLVLPIVLAVLGAVSLSAQTPAKPRVVITQDPELDDVNTVIRALLYTTDFKLEGLIYSSANIHWKGDGKGTTQYNAGRGQQTSHRWPIGHDKWIDALVDGYAQVHANLKVHNAAYPTPAEVRSKVKWGNVEFGGDYSKDTDGSNLIKSLLLDNVPGPLFVTAGGGQSTIGRALKSIYDQYSKTPQWASIQDKVSKKLVIIPWGDQDGVNGRYIRPNWPNVQTWTLAMIQFGYGARGAHTPENQAYLGTTWTQENVSSRGVLGAMYRVWGDGKGMAQGDVEDYFGFVGLTAEQLTGMGFRVWTPPQEKGSFISEGDTPTFMNLLSNGLRAHEGDGSWGGWGGRRNLAGGGAGGGGRGGAATPASPEDPGIAPRLAPAGSLANIPLPVPAPTEAAAPAGGAAAAGRGAGRGGAAAAGGGAGRGGGPGGAGGPLTKTQLVNAKFFAAAQQDFAARLKWSVTPRFADANHEPKVAIKGALAVSAKPGATVHLEGEVSDPDRNQVTTNWWQYNDAGTYAGDIALADAKALATSFTVPADAQPGQTIHVILEGTDNGTPALTRYQRVVVTVQ
jgi:hypothetical protein